MSILNYVSLYLSVVMDVCNINIGNEGSMIYETRIFYSQIILAMIVYLSFLVLDYQEEALRNVPDSNPRGRRVQSWRSSEDFYIYLNALMRNQ